MPDKPTCWSCGYELTGLRVEDACPECGTPVWSHVESGMTWSAISAAQSSMVWGIVALVLFFSCLGPVAGLLAIPAILQGRRARATLVHARGGSSAASQATAGLICGWITAGLSVAIVLGFVAVAVWGEI